MEKSLRFSKSKIRVFYCMNKGMDSESDYMNDGTIARGGALTRKISLHTKHRRHTYRKSKSDPESEYDGTGGNPARILAAQRAAAQRAAKQRADAERAAAQRAAAAKAAAERAATQRAAAAKAAEAKAKAAEAKAKAAAAAKDKAERDAAQKKEDEKNKCISSGKDYISGKCLTKCPQGKIRSGTSCKDDPSAPCPSGQERVAGSCKPKCPQGKVRDGTSCKDDPTAPCPSGQERVGTSCKPKCPVGQIRSGQTCKDDPSTQCPAGQKKDSKKGCVPDTLTNCPPGMQHNGKLCVDGDPPQCSPTKERVGASCITKCSPGLRRKAGTTKCEDDPTHDCPEGEVKKTGRGCVNPSTGFSGLGLSSIIPPPGSVLAGVGEIALLAGGLYAVNALGGNEIVKGVNNIKTSINRFQQITDTPYGWFGAPINPALRG